MSSTSSGSEQQRAGFEPISGAVSEHIAARRLGLSVDTLRRDRRLGQLGIPFVKYGNGKCGAVRYDVEDLERFIAERKRRALPVARPVVVEQAPVLVPIAPEETVEPPVERIAPPAPRRPAYHRSPWEELAARYAEEAEDDPFAAAGRAAPPQPRRYWTG
jgi:hypothetical protein